MMTAEVLTALPSIAAHAAKETAMRVMIKSLLLGVLMFLTATAAVGGGEPDLSVVERVALEYVQANLDNPDVLLIDVRRFEDMIPPEKIPGALVKDWELTKQWSKDLPRGKEIITYCA